MYTRVPRPVMWLLRGNAAELGGDNDEPPFTVELESFYLSRGCVSNAQFEAYRPGFSRHARALNDADPAVGVSFRDAVGYADWYAQLSGKAFRLLTEAEWEFAARAFGRARYPWGDDSSAGTAYAWTLENSDGRCHGVEENKPSKVGIIGMIGNVWEWTSSLHRPFPVVPGDGRDALDIEGVRVTRGGGHTDPIAALSCSRREPVSEATRRPDLGFRIGRSL